MKRSLLGLSIACCCALWGGNWLIEAESLPKSGLWQTGTARAASKNAFVSAKQKNAISSGCFTFEKAGTYYIWIRNLSFSENWRRASLAVDGRRSSSVGDEKTTLGTPAWIWSKSKKPLLIQKGEHKIELIADSANVRVDAVLLTTDPKFVPEEGKLPDAGSFQVLLPKSDALKGALELHVACDKPAISYCCNEKITFTLTPRCGDKILTSGIISYHLRGDDGKDTSGKFHLSPQKNVLTLQTTLSSPGFVRLTADLLDENQKPLRSIDDSGKIYFGHFDGGAGAEIDHIPALPEPADFDSFWAKQKEKLDAVPIRADVKKRTACSDENFATYAVAIDCAGNRPATGFLVLPVDAAPKSLKAQLHFEGYGTGLPAVPGKNLRQKDAMILVVNAHGAPLEASREEYARFFGERKDYALTGNESPESCYFLFMVLRDLRAAQYLADRPEWNGKDLEVVGGSQGGLQSLWVASLDERVSRCRIEVPWQCNCGGRTLGLMAPEWGVAEYTPALEYFDAANHAKRIRCRVDVSRAGLGDYICPPSGVARMYYNLKCQKSITWVQNSSHGAIPENAESYHLENEELK